MSDARPHVMCNVRTPQAHLGRVACIYGNIDCCRGKPLRDLTRMSLRLEIDEGGLA